jgi:hypothetical protein
VLGFDHIPPPLLFNPLKHHLGFIREYISENLNTEKKIKNLSVIKDLKHIGGSLMDIYYGDLSPEDVILEILKFLEDNHLIKKDHFVKWAGRDPKDLRTIKLSDDSEWVLKSFNNEIRYVHPFPARYSLHSLRVKANSIRSAVLYMIFIGKDFITEEDLNIARSVSGLSPIKNLTDAEAITKMIELLRD